MANLFDTPTAPTSTAPSGNLFDTSNDSAPEIGPSSPSALASAGIKPTPIATTPAKSSGGILNTMGGALKDLEGKISNIITPLTKAPVPTTTPPPVATKATNLFNTDSSTNKVNQAVTSLIAKVPSIAKNVVNKISNVDSPVFNWVKGAVNTITTPFALNKVVGNTILNLAKPPTDDQNPAYQEQQDKEQGLSDMINANASAITSKNTAIATQKTALDKQIAQVEAMKVDSTNPSSVNTYNSALNDVKQKISDFNDSIDSFNNGTVAHYNSLVDNLKKEQANPVYSVNPNYKPNLFLDTLKQIPSQLLTSKYTLGIGDIISQLNTMTPDEINNAFSTGSLLKSLPIATQNFISGYAIDPVLTVGGALLAPILKNQGQINVDIPGLGNVSNIQDQVSKSVADGENPWVAIVNATPGTIMDGLMVAGLGDTIFGDRETSLGKTNFGPKNADVEGVENSGPKSFREYQPTTARVPVPNAILEKISKEQGIDFTKVKGFDPNNPTFFRMVGQADGTINGELVQVKPSFFKTFMNKFGGDANASPSSGLTVLNTQSVDVKDIENASQKLISGETTLAPEDLQNIAEQVKTGTSLASVKTEPIDITKTGIAPSDLITEAKKYDNSDDFIDSLKLTDQSNDNQVVRSLSKEIGVENFGSNGVFQLPPIKTNPKAISSWENKIKSGKRPIVITDDTGFPRLIDGNNRLQAYKNLGFKTVPMVSISDLKEIYNQAHDTKNISPEIDKLPISDEQKSAVQAFYEGDTTAKTRAILDSINTKVLDEASITRDNGVYARSTTDIQQRSGDNQNGSGNARGSILSISGRDRLDAEKRLATSPATTGDSATVARAEGKRLLNGEQIEITENTHNVFRALGFGDEFSDIFNEAFKAGGIKNVSFDAQIELKDGKKAEVNAAYAVVDKEGKRIDLLQLNYESRDMDLFQSGDIIRHEVFGHSWYTDLTTTEKLQIIDGLRDDKKTILNAWKNSVIEHNPYWEMTITQMTDLMVSKGVPKDMATEILKDIGIENKEQSLEDFIDASLNLDKTFDAINKQLEELGYPAIMNGFERTIAIHEQVALVAEQSNKISSTNPMIQSYINKVSDGTLSFKNKITAPSRTLTPSTMAAVKEQFEGFEDLSTKILEKLKGRDTVSKQFIEDLTNSGDVKQSERNIIRNALKMQGEVVNVKEFADTVKAELLPLKVNTLSRSKYEFVNLPEDLRGNVANYKENVYESPIKTRAGNIHFSNIGKFNEESPQGYFGHTRVEDMAGTNGPFKNGQRESADYIPGDVRRIIEVQSDLYQKGNLDKEIENYDHDVIGEKTFYKNQESRKLEVIPLQQYDNPSAHFRMVREEIKQAAIDGKTKLQFPTGETAMKIEGLGQGDSGNFTWDDITLTPDIVKVGREIQQASQKWVITENIGNGKFKAIPKRIFDQARNELKGYGANSHMAPIEEVAKSALENFGGHNESFDISGKIDTNNPIYRFYEKDLGRYLKNNYDAKEVTDDKGVSWYEVPINADDANKPVLASLKGEKPSNDDLQNLLKSSEEKARENRQSDRLKELDTVVADSSNHDAFMRNLKKNTKLSELLPQLDKDVRDNGYQNLSDYYVRNKITSNVENGVVPQRRYAPVKEAIVPPVPEVKKINVSNKEVPMSDQDKETLENIKTQRSLLQDMVDEHPGKKLTKFISRKEGVFEDFKDPSHGRTPSERKAIEARNKAIVTAAESAFDGTQYKDQFDNPDVIRAAIDDFQGLNADLEETKQTQKNFIDEERRIRNLSKDEVALEKEAKKKSVKELPQSVSDVIPPEVRGGIKAPHLDLEKWKDKNMAALNRDTFERNLEKVAPKSDADALKKFIVDPVRANETARIKFTNELKTRTLDKMKKFGISRNSTNDELIQKFGEGQISLTELQKLAPKKWGEIQQAADYFRKIYDQLLDQWNEVRKEYGYPAIPKRPDYFRHFDEVNFFTKTYGLLSSKNELPSSIAGKTEFFKPGKPFTTAELSRTGNSTKYSAIGGFNNYIDSVSKQIYHIESIQRGRALERYLENSAKVGETLGTPLHLSNVIANIREYVNNGLAGKTATLDRALEGTLGRPAIAAFQSLSKLIGKNIIVGNISTALSHLVSLPLIGATTDKIPLTKGMMTTLTSPFTKGGFNTIDGMESSFLTRRFPIEEIMPNMPKKAEQALSYLFIATDKFKSRVAVAGKYYEGIAKGFSKEEAMKQADTYAGKVIGDYSLGQKPNLMNAKTMTLLAQFQLGLNDSISVLAHDIPYQDRKYTTDEKTGETTSKARKWKVTSKLIQFAIFSYLFNLILKQIRGSGKGLDPIDVGLTLMGLNQEGQGQTFLKRAGSAVTDIAGELPFTSMFTGNFPLASAFSTPIGYLKSGNYKKAAESLAIDFASPIGGGAQAQKTILGAQSINAGETETRAQKAQALVFGAKATIPNNKASVNMAKTLKAAQTRLSKYDPATVAQVQAVFDQAKTAGLGTSEADQVVSSLTDAQYKIYKTIKEVDTDQNNIALESKVLPIVKQANNLGFGSDAANALVAPLSDGEYAAYQAIKTSLYGANATSSEGNPAPEVAGPGNKVSDSEITYDQKSFINHIYEAAIALGTDPVTTFNDIFAGNSSYRIAGVENGQVIVVRAPQQTTDAIKASQGGASAEYKLDHTIPLEIGGNNGADNLLLLPTGDANTPGTWAGNTATEDLLGNALANGTVTGKQAREYIIRYKAGVGEKLSAPLMKEYKDKYNSQPLTAEQVKDLVK